MRLWLKRGSMGLFVPKEMASYAEITMTAQCTADMVSEINAVLVDKEFAIAWPQTHVGRTHKRER